MRTFFIFLCLLILLAIGYLGYAQLSGGAVPTFGLPIGGERALVRQHIRLFFENVRFKNKVGLSAFVASGSTLEDIEKFLTQTFGVDPAHVDLHQVKIESVELDSASQRARALVRFIGQNLQEQKPLDVTKLIFLYKEGRDNWLIDIKNLSL